MDDAARHGGAADIPAVVDLAREGREAIAEARGGQMWLLREALPEPLEPTLEALVGDDHGLVVVATIDNVPLGFMLVQAVEDALGTVADILELYVTPEARGVALGEHMMAEVLRFADDRGCRGISGRALPGDRATKNFFETFGLVARSIEVFRSTAS